MFSPIKKIRVLFLLLLLPGAAYQPGLVAAPRPTPSILTVQSTPALQSLAKDYQGCVEEQANAGLVLLDTPAASIDLKQASLALRWGASSAFKGYAAVIGNEELDLIVHPSNLLNSISLAEIKAIYSGSQPVWPGGDPAVEIQPWVYLTGDDAQSIFEAAVLAGQPPSTRVVSLAPDPAAMREAVAASPAAVGFLPRRWVDSSVKVIPVTDLDPARLRQPILALSRSEPQGLDKSWLLCLQEKLSE